MSHHIDLEDVEVQRRRIRRDLISNMPFWLAITRIFQMILAFLDLFLTGYAVSVFGGDEFHTFGSSFVSFVCNIILMLYIFVTPQQLPKLYCYRVHIILEIITTVSWIVTVALLAWGCQTFNTTEYVLVYTAAAVGATLSDNLPNEMLGITAFRMATFVASLETALFTTTMFIIRRLLIQSMTE